MKPESLVRIPQSESSATLEVLASWGITQENYAGIRKDREICRQIAEILKFGGLVKTRSKKLKLDFGKSFEELRKGSGFIASDTRIINYEMTAEKFLCCRELNVHLLNFPVDIDCQSALHHVKAMKLKPGSLEFIYVLSRDYPEFIEGEYVILLGSPIPDPYPGRILYPFADTVRQDHSLSLPLEPDPHWASGACSFLAYTFD
jgi:hypothetical protein